jgi:hypothetical protein
VADCLVQTRYLIHINEATPTTRTLCRSKERCVLDLAQECDELANPVWREYCPNATTLNALGALQNCARARQYLRTPRSTGYLANE